MNFNNRLFVEKGIFKKEEFLEMEHKFGSHLQNSIQVAIYLAKILSGEKGTYTISLNILAFSSEVIVFRVVVFETPPLRVLFQPPHWEEGSGPSSYPRNVHRSSRGTGQRQAR